MYVPWMSAAWWVLMACTLALTIAMFSLVDRVNGLSRTLAREHCASIAQDLALRAECVRRYLG
jgi:hypothetical protein